MFLILPKPHKFKKGIPPTMTTSSSNKVEILHNLTPCKSCGLFKDIGCHKDKK